MMAIAVADLEATLFRTTEPGARTIVEPWDVTETHRLAIIEDHEGNRTGLHSARESAWTFPCPCAPVDVLPGAL